MASQLILVRHGETEWSLSRQHTGNTDIPLTPKGREAAIALGTTLTAFAPAVVLSSPLQRARVTAELSLPQYEVLIQEDLREWDYGDYEGITTKQIHQTDPGWSLWEDGAPGGEMPGEVGARCDRMLDVAAGTDGVVAVFGHGHSLRCLAARWLGLEVSFGRRITLDTASISVLGYEHDNSAILHWNVSGAFVSRLFSTVTA